jgi:hypothetical protein
MTLAKDLEGGQLITLNDGTYLVAAYNSICFPNRRVALRVTDGKILYIWMDTSVELSKSILVQLQKQEKSGPTPVTDPFNDW